MPKPLDDTEEEFLPEEETPSARPAASSPSGLRRGWSAGQQMMDSNSSFAQALKLDDKTQIIKFLEDEPYANYARHWVDRVNAQGQKMKRPYTCLNVLNRRCPLCDKVGDRPQMVSSFNVALIGDDGVATLKSWDVGVKVFSSIRSFANDPKFSPITKGYWAVNKTGKAQSSQVNLIPVRSDASLLEDYGVTPPTPESLSSLGVYDAEIIQIPKLSDLEEIAAELTDEVY